MRYAIILLTATIPLQAAHAATAIELETECREELNLGVEELQPGIDKSRLRGCIRNKSANARRAEVYERRATRTQTVETTEDEIRPSVKLDLECREQLGIGAKEIINPGPQLGTLRRCINRLQSEQSRRANTIRRRTSVEERKKRISETLLREKKEKLDQQLESKSRLQRNRLQTQQVPSPRRFKIINDSLRARTDFSDEHRRGSDAEKRLNAQDCRKVSAKEWAKCIREALAK